MSDHSQFFAAPADGALAPSVLLKWALLGDGIASAASGLLMLAGADMLDELTGLPTGLLRYAGLFLLPYAALVGWMGLRPRPPRWLVWTVVVGNLAWTVESALLLLSGWVQPTAYGIAFVLAEAAVVALFAELQFIGLRRSTHG